MFTNLIGFIRPFLKKNVNQPTEAYKTREAGEDEPEKQRTFDDILHHPEDDLPNDKPPAEIHPNHDELELSISALKHLVETSEETADDKKEAWLILSALEKQGYRSLPLDSEQSIIKQLQNYKV